MILSVIIPVYKVEQTLDRCVKSVLSQDIEDMEIILVDDGSPDKCPVICDKLAESDNRIKVVHKNNGGLSDARNVGIDIAKGDYITFVDSDDYIMPDTYKPLISLLKTSEADIDILEYQIKQEDKKRIPLVLENRTFSSANDYWLSTKGWCHAYAWNKIYKREIFSNCRFHKGRIFEDLLLIPLLLRKSKNVMTTSHGIYVYTVNQEGISKQTTKNVIFQLLCAEAKAAWIMKTMPWSKNGKNLYYYMCCRCYDILRILLGKKL